MEKRTGIKCLVCNDVVISQHRHDMRPCKCGAAFVDGGSEYTRYGAMDMKKVQLVDGIYDPKTGKFAPNGLERATKKMKGKEKQ